jgi:nucleotide-binding universal stress UspA family protein
MKKILVPCDFSPPATEAYKVALNIAGRSQGEIVLFHVITLPTFYAAGFAGEPAIYDTAYYSRMETDISRELAKLKTKGEQHHVSVTTDVQVGGLVSCITKTVKEENIDLIMMGTSGSSGIAEILIGSNVEKVVRFSPVPVLSVRTAFDSTSIQNILLPSTLGLNQHDFMRELKKLQQFFNATIHVLLVNTPVHFRQNRDANQTLTEFAHHYQLTNYKLHFKSFYQEEEGIMTFAHTEKMDLIAMPTHARKGFAHVFNSSVTENIVNHIESPIWTYCLKKLE